MDCAESWAFLSISNLGMNGSCGILGISNLGMNGSCGNPAMGWMEVFGTKNLWIIMVSADVDQKTLKNLMVFKVFTWKCANWLGGVAKFGVKKLNGSGNESTARKMARGKTQTAAERRACIKSHRKFIWFGKILGSSTVNSPSVPKSLPKMHFLTKNLRLWRSWESLLGI